ncbi:MAG: YceI family protein [Verrucomicrobiales bacterium]|nr:YceI family protein [Verrucomicrobiales bacterium]
MSSFLTARQVRELREGNAALVVLDVRRPEAYDAAHLAGALNTCVFEIAFVEEVRRRVPDLETPIIVYGLGPTSFESTDAARRLIEAGYRRIHNFPGGLVEWKTDGLPTLGSGALLDPPPLQGVLPLDLTESRVEWTGRNLLNKHRGQLRVTAGSLEFRDGWLVGGEVALDLRSVSCTDLTDPALNRLLLEHLRSADFLDAERHPEAKLVIRRTAPVANGRPGAPNLQMIADLTFRGITREITALAVAGRTPEGRVGAQSLVVLDRTDWGSAYGSGRFFQDLGQHLVNDHVELEVRLVTGP